MPAAGRPRRATAAAAAPSRRCRRAWPGPARDALGAVGGSASQPGPGRRGAHGPPRRYRRGGARNAPQVQLAAIVVNGVERPDPLAVITSPEGTLVALDYVVAALHLAVQAEADAYRIATPLGEARIPTDALRAKRRLQLHRSADTGAQPGAELHFDPGEYALRVNLGWDPYAATSQAARRPRPRRHPTWRAARQPVALAQRTGLSPRPWRRRAGRV